MSKGEYQWGAEITNTIVFADLDNDATRFLFMNVNLTDLGEIHMIHIHHGVLPVYENTTRNDADVSITCPKNALFGIVSNNAALLSAISIQDAAALVTLMAESMKQFPIVGMSPFNIIEP